MASTATEGANHSIFLFDPQAANQYVPIDFPARTYRREEWCDYIILRPAEYFGVKFDKLAGGPVPPNGNPNGNERLFIQCSWDEVTL